MEKWADFLISEVSYDSNHQIVEVKQHQEIDGSISDGELVDRLTIADNLKKGLTYLTIYSGLKGFRKGFPVSGNRVNEGFFIRTDKNKVELDFLGDIPTF